VHPYRSDAPGGIDIAVYHGEEIKPRFGAVSEPARSNWAFAPKIAQSWFASKGAGAGNPPASGDTGDSNDGGSEVGSQSGGGASQSPPPAPTPSPGGGDDGGGDGGGGDDDGGSDD
jgi:hypothetical protein